MKNILYKIRTIKALDIFNFGNYSPSNEDKNKPSEPNKETPYTPYKFNKDDTEYIINTSIVSLIQENALFYQIERINNYQPVYEGFNDNIINDIIYIDFNDIYIADEKEDALSYSNEMRALLKYGFTLTYEENKKIFEVHYEKFERSGSMARDKRLSFIREDLKENLERALRLDIRPEEVVLSKWYAYNGLMLSSGTRINLSRFHFRFKNKKLFLKKVTGTYHLKISKKDLPIKLNENSVIVVEDKKIDKGGVKSNLFDGEGIVSPVFADFIRKCLCYDKNNQKTLPTSFQIRMPYVKGMLHQVDFHSFAKEPDVNETTIEDCWGIKHKVDEVQIILTESMFKGKEWFEEHVAKECEKIETWNEKEGSEKKKIIGTKVMKHYFEKFIKYDHAIYVTGFNKPHHGRINLNYQVLSTPKLNQEQFLKLGDKTKDIYEKLMPDNSQDKEQDKNKQDVIKAFLNDVNFFLSADEIEKNDEDSDENAQIELTDDAKNTYSRYDSGIRKAVRIKPELINSKKAKTCIANMADHTLAQYGIARFLVRGVNLYLSGDLLYFLYYIFDKDIPEEEKLYNDKFYAPGVRCGIYNSNKKDKTKKKYAVLRNPHISNKELVSLNAFKPKEETKRERYLKHLTGVLIINSGPIKVGDKMRPSIAEHLSGADYDGDIVKLVKEDEYNEAMPKFSEWRAYEFEPIPKPQVSSVRLNDDGIEEHIYKMLAMTFGNRIGMFSNYAFKHAVHAYNANKKETTNKDTTVRYTEKAVDKLFSILGQEIDSAKTGKRPKIDNNDLVIKQDDYFIEWKKAINDVLKESKFKIKAEEEFTNHPVVHKLKEGVIVPADSNSTIPNFYILPYQTLKLKGLVEIKEEKVLVKPESKRGTQKGNKHFNIGEYILNCFENHPEIDLKTVIEFVNLVNEYNKAISNLGKKKHAKIEIEKNKNDNIKRNTNEYMSILFKQYSDHEKKRDVMHGIVKTLRDCKKRKLYKEKIDENKNAWLYSVNPKKELEEYFIDEDNNNECIFTEEQKDLLCNFSYGGYKLLIIALNLAYPVDFNLPNTDNNNDSIKKGNKENSKYKFEELDDFRLIDSRAKRYVDKLFGEINQYTNEEERNRIITKRLCYYALCANLNGILSSNKERIFVSESAKDVVDFGKLCVDIEKGISDQKLTEEEGVVACISRIGNYSFCYGLRDLFLNKSDALLSLAADGSVLYRCFQYYFETISQLFISLSYGCKKFGNKRKKYTKTCKYKKYSAVKLSKCERNKLKDYINAFKNRKDYINAFKNRKAILEFKKYFENKKRSAFKIKKGDIKIAMASFLSYCEENCTFIQYAENFYNENITLKKENDSKSFFAYKRNKLNTRPNVKNFISLLLLGNEKYEFDSSENFLWSIFANDFLTIISADNSSNNDTDTENNKTKKEGSESND